MRPRPESLGARHTAASPPTAATPAPAPSIPIPGTPDDFLHVRPSAGAVPVPRAIPPGTVLQLQRRYGNRAVTQMLQRVNAYRVEYSHNRKVATDDSGKVTGLTAPIDISFVMPDHSEYFASERKQEQIKGLRRVAWEMNDDWWDAVRFKIGVGPSKLSGKARNWYEKMGKAGKPAWSDGASLTKFIKQTALHFQDNWQELLGAAIVKGTGSVEDLEAEYYETRAALLTGADEVWAWHEATDEERAEDDFDDSRFGPGEGFVSTVDEAKEQGAEYMHPGLAESRGYKRS